MRHRRWLTICLGLVMTFLHNVAVAQTSTDTLRIATVTRAPFSMVDSDGRDTGFSIELLNRVADELDITVEYERFDTFIGMLGAVESGNLDGAIANITITADREEVMDFTQPIFDGGIQVMLKPEDSSAGALVQVLFTRQVGMTVLAALALLGVLGMIMWVFERKRQPYFDRSARDAVFPSFWWALNLVVNGGFEERMPQSRPGRFFAVVLVVSSLFIVSIFVAQITAALTVNAISDNFRGIADLRDKRVGTLAGSTSAEFLIDNVVPRVNFRAPDAMFAAYEDGDLDAVVFDGPILAYYVQSEGADKARLVETIYQPEKYGMALPTGSPNREPINRAILALREDGTYRQLLVKWFGEAYSRN